MTKSGEQASLESGVHCDSIPVIRLTMGSARVVLDHVNTFAHLAHSIACGPEDDARGSFKISPWEISNTWQSYSSLGLRPHAANTLR